MKKITKIRLIESLPPLMFLTSLMVLFYIYIYFGQWGLVALFAFYCIASLVSIYIYIKVWYSEPMEPWQENGEKQKSRQ